ncbi:MAG: hypothetical protein SGARI_001828 [Bacillariaceae sp.]
MIKGNSILEEMVRNTDAFRLWEKYEDWEYEYRPYWEIDVKMLGSALKGETPAFEVLKSLNDLKLFQSTTIAGSYAFVMYVVDHDKWCQKYLPKWQQLAKILRDDDDNDEPKGALGNISLGVFENSQRRFYDVGTVPMFLLYHNSQLVTRYFGNRTVESFLQITGF